VGLNGRSVQEADQLVVTAHYIVDIIRRPNRRDVTTYCWGFVMLLRPGLHAGR